ncbi:uncharacterized protein DC041_0011076 [Schistosoma bovis]|uniref:TRF2-interacting telomeric protein/Rap1 C-terminal domain-containing protein n=1 Tax=Schistosoma bovis TaxID=6184 RepID=A0A430QUD9_SCHBO|nr:uncharacterized protein DC041_0011076 [Schistosoma bovis]
MVCVISLMCNNFVAVDLKYVVLVPCIMHLIPAIYVERVIQVASEILVSDNDDLLSTTSDYRVSSNRSRKPFTKKESLAILNYIQDNNLLSVFPFTEITHKKRAVELHNIFFGGSKRYTNPIEENKYNDALSDDGACHSSYSIDECSLNLNKSNTITTYVLFNQSQKNHLDKSTDKETSPTTVQRDKFGDVLPDPTKSFSPFLRDQISVCSYESPKRFCNNYPRPPTIIATNTKKASESNDLPNASTSLSSLNESLLELIQGTPSQDSSSPSYLSLMTSDSSPSFDPMKYPVWVSKLINCTSYITTPLQAILLVYMTNGSVAEAYNFLTTGKRRPSSITNFSPPLWSPDDDECLGSTDQNKLDELVSRFGWIDIVKRVGFLQNKNNIDTSDIIKK